MVLPLHDLRESSSSGLAQDPTPWQERSRCVRSSSWLAAAVASRTKVTEKLPDS
jgi:hypothetical protein